MDIRRLRYFLSIIEHGSFSRSAEALGVAQPALSQHVRRLEEILGVTLLIRGPRGVVPTAQGEELANDARNIIALVNFSMERIRRHASEPSGTIAFGLPSSLGMSLSVPLIESVNRDLPKVTLRIVENLSGYILEWLQSGRLNMSILYDCGAVRGITGVKLLREDLYLIMPASQDRKSPRHSPGDETEVPMHELSRYNFILPGQPHGLRMLIDRYTRKNGVRLNVTTEIDSFTQIKALVSRGAGCSIVAYSAIYEEVSRGKLIAKRIVEPTIERTAYLAHATERPLSGAGSGIQNLTVSIIKDFVSAGLWRAELLI